jgi:hypothetical protein
MMVLTFDHFVKVVSDGLLTKITIFHFEVNNYSRKNFEIF